MTCHYSILSGRAEIRSQQINSQKVHDQLLNHSFWPPIGYQVSITCSYRLLTFVGLNHPNQGPFWKSAWIDLNGNVPHKVALHQKPARCLSEWVSHPKKEWLGQRHGHKFSLRHNSTRFREAIGPWFRRKTPTYVHCPNDLRSQELFLLQFYRHSKNVMDSWLFWSEMTWSTKLILTFLYFWELFIETLWREVYRTRHYRFLHMQFGCSKGFHVYQFDPGVRRQKASSSSAQWGGGQSSQRIDRTLILRYSHFSATFAILPRWTLKSEWQTNLILRFVCIQQPSYSLLKSHHIYLPIGHQYLPNERAIHQGLVNYKTHFFSRGC